MSTIIRAAAVQFYFFDVYPRQYKGDDNYEVYATSNLDWESALWQRYDSNFLKRIKELVERIHSLPIPNANYVVLDLEESLGTSGLDCWTQEIEFGIERCLEEFPYYWAGLKKYPGYISGEIWAAVRENGQSPVYFNPKWVDNGSKEKVLKRWYAVAKAEVGYNRLQIGLVGGRTEGPCPKILFYHLLRAIEYERSNRQL